MARATGSPRAAAPPATPPAIEGRRRAVVEAVRPEIDGGRFAVKRCVGDVLRVECDAFADGHDAVRCVLLHRAPGAEDWTRTEMAPVGDDRWAAGFPCERMGMHRYTVQAWVDPFASWRHGLRAKADAGQDVGVELLSGAMLLRDAAGRARGRDTERLEELARLLGGEDDPARRLAAALGDDTAELALRYPDTALATDHPRELRVWVDRERARYSSWYELFPRSWSPEPGRHGTLADVEAALEYVAGMGFDVLYLPPIHPIGRVRRKGRNNAVAADEGDVGSPWAIGAAEGGHDAVHPALGTHEDVRRLAAAARDRGIDLALDLALQCAPDHPWVTRHPEWFRMRPDGSVQYAENPPKRYEDIYPLDFETPDWRALWSALLDVVMVWVDLGVRVFRVDNPHTKPFAFWDWLIGEVRDRHPDVLFLAEAFTRPKVMHRLAKLGFSQSYTYFTWRTARWEITEYLTQLTRTELADVLRPNMWPNTPDILTEQLQEGGRPVFMSRAVLAATLAASYGVYGPAFELAEDRPRAPGGEEYLDSEKYQLRSWDRDSGWSLRPLLTRLNAIRAGHRALQGNDTLEFHPTDNDHLLCYSKTDPAGGGATVLCVVNLDPHSPQTGWTALRLDVLGLGDDEAFQAHDLLGGARFMWRGARNFVHLEPHGLPAHVFAIRRRVRTERDFDYFG